MLEVAGFDVVDLGVDTPAETILKAVQETGIRIVLLSGVLTLSLESMERTIKLLAENGIRNQVKVLIGGNPVSAEWCQKMGADAWAVNPQDTVNYCRQWAKEM